jgi:hypothetical protein
MMMALDKEILEQLDRYVDSIRESASLILESKVRQVAYEYIIESTATTSNAYKRGAYMRYFAQKIDEREHR